MDMRFQHGATHLLCAPSGAGKTYSVATILRHRKDMIPEGAAIKNVIFFYNVLQDLYDELKEEGVVTKWVQKRPTNDEFIEHVKDFKHDGGSIAVIDDWMEAIDSDLATIVTVTARHYLTTTYILFQSLFPPHPMARQISLNVKYVHGL